MTSVFYGGFNTRLVWVNKSWHSLLIFNSGVVNEVYKSVGVPVFYTGKKVILKTEVCDRGSCFTAADYA